MVGNCHDVNTLFPMPVDQRIRKPSDDMFAELAAKGRTRLRVSQNETNGSFHLRRECSTQANEP